LNSIDHSDVVVVVTTQEIPTIKNVSLCLDLLHNLGVQKDRIVLTMNRFDKRIAITPERVGKNLKQDVAAIIPLDERIVINAVNRGIPFMIDNKTQLVARGVYALAESVRGRLATLETEQETSNTGKR
jgi:pilus assembly protein CpaE